MSKASLVVVVVVGVGVGVTGVDNSCNVGMAVEAVVVGSLSSLGS